MKILKTASGKQTVKISKKEWQSIGKKAGWMKIASTSRDQVIMAMKQLLGKNAFVKTSEEFDPNMQGGIWFSNEGEGIDGLPIYDASGETEMFNDFGGQGYPYQFNPEFEEMLSHMGWFAEPYDGGTLMAFPS